MKSLGTLTILIICKGEKMIRIFLFLLLFIVIGLVAGYVADTGEHQLSKAIRKAGYGCLAVVILVSAIFSTVFITDNKQIGYVNCLGIITPFDNTGGVKFKVPFLSDVKVYPATVQSLTIGYRLKLGKTTEGKDDVDNYETVEEESLMITKDFNFIDVDADIEFKIVDPKKFDLGTINPIDILVNSTQIAMRNNVGLTNVDDALTTGRSELESNIFDSIRSELDTHATGIELTKFIIQEITMPNEEIQEEYEKVNSAMTSINTLENQARAYYNEQVPSAEGDAQQTIEAAEAIKLERINSALAEVSQFETLWVQYNNSDLVMEKLYYDAIKEILPNMDIFISPDGKTVFVQGNSSNVQVAGTANIQ